MPISVVLYLKVILWSRLERGIVRSVKEITACHGLGGKMRCSNSKRAGVEVTWPISRLGLPLMCCLTLETLINCVDILFSQQIYNEEVGPGDIYDALGLAVQLGGKP